MTMYKKIYERFINLAIATEGLSERHNLAPMEKRILAVLGVVWSKGEKITVVNSMNLVKEISSMTSFRYLKELRKKGYIELIVDGTDNRIKYVSPTARSDEYFSEMGRLMSKAVDEKNADSS